MTTSIIATASTSLTAALDFAMTIMGTVVTVQPQIGIKMWHFSPPGVPESIKDSTHSLILDELPVFAVREFCIGASILAELYLGDRKILSSMLILGVLIVVTDGIVQRRQAGRGHWVHWALAPVLVSLAII